MTHLPTTGNGAEAATRGSGSRAARRWRALAVATALGYVAAGGMALAAAAASFTASLDREVVTLGESATLALRFEGGEPRTVPVPPAIPNLEIAYLGPTKEIAIVNQAVSSSVTHSFRITPRQAGEYTLPEIVTEVAGQQLRSAPLRLTVLKPNAAPEGAGAAGQLAFLRVLLPKKEVYLGEVIIAELQFHYRQGTHLAGTPQITDLPVEGLAVGNSVLAAQRQVRVGGTAYNVLPALVALTVLKTGPLRLGPVTATVALQLPVANRRRDPFFEPFGLRDPFDLFGRNEQRSVPVAADPETLLGLPLPTHNVPASFHGAVGNFQMSFSASPTNLTVGDPITVRVQITGRGALETLTLPEPPAWKDFKLYPPTTEVKTADALGVQGTKLFEQVVVPQNADIRELPALEFSFFDPEQKAYRTLRQPAVPLQVQPGGATPAPVVAPGRPGPAESPSPPAQDIVGLKPHLGPVATARPPLVLRTSFLGAQAAPLLAWLAAVAWRKRADTLARNPRLRRRRQVAQIVNDGLEQLRALAAANRPDEFFATLFRLLQEQIGERLDVPASSITEAIVDERLKPAGLADSACAALHELFQACNLARFAPGQTGPALAALVPRVEAVILQLRKFEP